MKIILLTEVPKLGSVGDIVDVADGYGRNFLVPKGQAMVWTKGNERQLAETKRGRGIRVRKRELSGRNKKPGASEKVPGLEVRSPTDLRKGLRISHVSVTHLDTLIAGSVPSHTRDMSSSHINELVRRKVLGSEYPRAPLGETADPWSGDDGVVVVVGRAAAPRPASYDFDDPADAAVVEPGEVGRGTTLGGYFFIKPAPIPPSAKQVVQVFEAPSVLVKHDPTQVVRPRTRSVQTSSPVKTLYVDRVGVDDFVGVLEEQGERTRLITFPKELVSDDQLSALEEGAYFYWLSGTKVEGGRRQRVDEVVFQMRGAPTQHDIKEADNAADAILAALHQSDRAR